MSGGGKDEDNFQGERGEGKSLVLNLIIKHLPIGDYFHKVEDKLEHSVELKLSIEEALKKKSEQ